LGAGEDLAAAIIKNLLVLLYQREATNQL
jgi:hypothetical protein